MKKKLVWHRSGVSNTGCTFSVAPNSVLLSMQLPPKTGNFIPENLSMLRFKIYATILVCFLSSVMSWLELARLLYFRKAFGGVMGTASLPGVKMPGGRVDNPRSSGAEVKERADMYIFSPSEPSRQVIQRTLPSPLWVKILLMRCDAV
jgi:hypothetical protein